MPDQDGYWLRERLRTAGAQALERGFTAHLPKPIDPAELCRSVKTAARR